MDFTFDYFKIDHEEPGKALDSSSSVHEVLKKIEGLNRQERIRNIYRVPSRIHDLLLKDEIWYGSFMKIRMDSENLPPKSKLTGETENLNFDDDEGLGELVGFLYDPRHRILVIQRSRYGIGPGGMKYYLERMGKFSFHMEPIIQQDALERLKQKDVIRRFELKLVRPEGKIRKEIEGKSTHKALDLLDDFDSYYVDIKFGFDNTKKNKGKVLNKQAIVSLANRFLGGDEEIVEKFRVYGNEGDVEKYNFVDLIKDRISEVRTAEVSKTNRMTFKRMNELLLSAYNSRRQEIILQYFQEV
ncbi:hypothetical protein IJ21_18100 [Paenibacillus sp. 32O-W]|uniref:DUF6731 family protein n=1 Tax=Paenibacillus sp. 32O-W TaxID=1695218 RepID=UPI00071EE25B|nr:DUF6731 family protein [Paenibacillus sp. 32O-W]ALS27211.1 hypothetical protein IJ21_18100 [Paenibacillus sp. 32O-W]